MIIYSGQLNILGLGPANQLIAKVGGWPVLGNHSELSNQEVFKAVNDAGFTQRNIVVLSLKRKEKNIKSKILLVSIFNDSIFITN